jgi:hypothetical protein
VKKAKVKAEVKAKGEVENVKDKGMRLIASELGLNLDLNLALGLNLDIRLPMRLRHRRWDISNRANAFLQ